MAAGESTNCSAAPATTPLPTIWQPVDRRPSMGETLETLGDKQIVNVTAATESWYVNPITGYLGIDNEIGADTAATDLNYEVRTKDVEEIVINTGGGGDSVVI